MSFVHSPSNFRIFLAGLHPAPRTSEETHAHVRHRRHSRPRHAAPSQPRLASPPGSATCFVSPLRHELRQSLTKYNFPECDEAPWGATIAQHAWLGRPWCVVPRAEMGRVETCDGCRRVAAAEDGQQPQWERMQGVCWPARRHLRSGAATSQARRVLLVGRMEAVQVDRGVRSSSVQKTAEHVATPEQHGASAQNSQHLSEAHHSASFPITSQV